MLKIRQFQHHEKLYAIDQSKGKMPVCKIVGNNRRENIMRKMQVETGKLQ